MFETDEVRVGKYTVSVIKDDQYIGMCLRRGYEWDGWMRHDLPHLVKPGMDILDIGGNIGWNALMFSDYCPVHCFEPLYHPVVTKNVNQNSSLKNPVSVYPYGLSSEDGQATIFIPRRDKQTGTVNYGGASLVPDDFWYDQATGGHTIELKKLDDVYSGKPCLIKLDVERHELDVIKGAWGTITKWKPSMYIEILESEKDEITPLMKSIGYVRYERPENNYLFISPQHNSS
jgi:FkbM family methyltransferase